MTRGVYLLRTHPQVAALSCADCKIWSTNEDWTITERAGQKQRRVLGTVTPCHICPKIPQGAPPVPESAAELTPQLYQSYIHYRRCRAVGRFPADDVVEDNARVFCEIEDQIAANRLDQIELGIRLVSVAFGGLPRG